MKTINIHSITTEFPNQVTTVGVKIIEKTGSITKVLEQLTVELPGIFQNLNSNLIDKITSELTDAGYDIQSGVFDTAGE